MDHFERSALDGIHEALKVRDFASARGLAAFGAAEGSSEYCIKLVETFIDWLSTGEEIDVTFELFLTDL